MRTRRGGSASVTRVAQAVLVCSAMASAFVGHSNAAPRPPIVPDPDPPPELTTPAPAEPLPPYTDPSDEEIRAMVEELLSRKPSMSQQNMIALKLMRGRARAEAAVLAALDDPRAKPRMHHEPWVMSPFNMIGEVLVEMRSARFAERLAPLVDQDPAQVPARAIWMYILTEGRHWPRIARRALWSDVESARLDVRLALFALANRDPATLKDSTKMAALALLAEIAAGETPATPGEMGVAMRMYFLGQDPALDALTTPRFLRLDNRNLAGVLLDLELKRKKVDPRILEPITRALLADHATRTPQLAAALPALARAAPDTALPLIEQAAAAASTLKDPSLRSMLFFGAAQALIRAAGFEFGPNVDLSPASGYWHLARDQSDAPELPPARRQIRAALQLQSELIRGGFLGYFDKSEGDSFSLALDGLNALNAPSLLEISISAAYTFEEFPESTSRERRAQVAGLGRERRKELIRLGKEFNDRIEDFPWRVARFIYANRHLYTVLPSAPAPAPEK